MSVRGSAYPATDDLLMSVSSGGSAAIQEVFNPLGALASTVLTRLRSATVGQSGDYLQLQASGATLTTLAGLTSTGAYYLAAGASAGRIYTCADATGLGGWAAPAVQTSNLLASAVHLDTTTGAVARGALIAGIGATPKWTAVASGAPGTILTMGASEPAWATPNLSAAWPIGSIFICATATAPSVLLGFGTWEAFGQGRVLLGLGSAPYDTVGATGGAASVAASGSNAAEATHTHSVTTNVYVTDHGVVETFVGDIYGKAGTGASTNSSSGHVHAVDIGAHNLANNAVTSGAGASHGHAFTGAATSVVQPYIIVYFWKRTA
jgi:hypothetical protein